jgi:DNA-binding NarL/FixJ family response regulator
MATPPQKRALVVEDDDAIASEYVGCLERDGLRVDAVTSMDDARFLLQSTSVFDVAVLDMKLPDGSGAELVQPLLDRRPLCRSLVVTGLRGGDIAAHALGLGAHKFLRKPVFADQLKEAVRDTLQATEAWRRAVEGPHPADSDGLPMRCLFDIDAVLDHLGEEAHFTPQQRLVAYRMLMGDSDKEIAVFLGCTARTAQAHVRAVVKKAGAKNRGGLIAVLVESLEG